MTSSCRLADLSRHRAESVAVVHAGVSITYGHLAGLVEAATLRLSGAGRRLVLLAGGNHLDAVVWYLAALNADQPLILVPGDHRDHASDVMERYQPDVSILPGPDGSWSVHEHREESIHDLHPDLSLMLSTSGSTGSPKLVRLSAHNIDANAASIAEYLALSEADRAITTLPMQYSYGLSVINSHLLVGASLVLTSASVIDTSFWDLVDVHAPTSMAGVPHTFSLLERTDFASRDLPFRYLTQAGGRLAPEKVRSFGRLCRERGMQLFVMYGQTEATARMAYLPPHLVETHPSAVGIPIPGGEFALEPSEGHDSSDGTGELVYRGPNVMMGYAESSADLSRGRELTALHTGDLARWTEDGLLEIVGRTARFAKVFGLRIDLARVEAHLETHAVPAAAASLDDAVGVLVAAPGSAELARTSIADLTGLPPHVIRVMEVEDLPRLSTGKIDYPAVAAALAEQSEDIAARDVSDLDAALRIYQDVLDRDDVSGDDSFVGLGGDSLSFVELSIRLEQLLHVLPGDWPTMSINELVACARPASPDSVVGWRRWLQARSFETTAVARAFGIFLVLLSHILTSSIQGGGHILIFASGFSFARFQLNAYGWARTRKLLATARRIVVPSLVAMGIAQLITGVYDWHNAIFAETIAEPNRPWGDHYNFWYLEFVVQTLLVLAVLLSIPVVSRLERRWQLGFPVVLVLLAFVPRFGLIPGFDPPAPEVQPINVAWVFLLGWAAARCTSTRQRVLVTGLVLLGVINMFPASYHDRPREVIILCGALVVIWVARVRLPAFVSPLVVIAASASLYIYVTHFTVMEVADRNFEISGPIDRLTLYFVALAVGVAYWWVWVQISSWLAKRWHERTQAPGPAGSVAASAAWATRAPKRDRDAGSARDDERDRSQPAQVAGLHDPDQQQCPDDDDADEEQPHDQVARAGGVQA